MKDRIVTWLRDTAWPKLRDGATRWFKALYGDPLMHVLTAALAVIGTKVFW